MEFKSKILTNTRLRRYRKPRTEDYMQITLTILLVVVFLAFAISPSVSTAFKLHKQIREYKILDEQLTQKILAMREVKANYKEITPDIHLLDQTIPNKPNDGRLLATLSRVTAASGTIITSTDFSESMGKPVNTLNINLEIIGNYESVKAFLNKTNNMLRIIKVDTITIRENSRYIKNRIGASIQAKAYFYTN